MNGRRLRLGDLALVSMIIGLTGAFCKVPGTTDIPRQVLGYLLTVPGSCNNIHDRASNESCASTFSAGSILRYGIHSLSDRYFVTIEADRLISESTQHKGC